MHSHLRTSSLHVSHFATHSQAMKAREVKIQNYQGDVYGMIVDEAVNEAEDGVENDRDED